MIMNPSRFHSILEYSCTVTVLVNRPDTLWDSRYPTYHVSHHGYCHSWSPYSWSSCLVSCICPQWVRVMYQAWSIWKPKSLPTSRDITRTCWACRTNETSDVVATFVALSNSTVNPRSRLEAGRVLRLISLLGFWAIGVFGTVVAGVDTVRTGDHKECKGKGGNRIPPVSNSCVCRPAASIDHVDQKGSSLKRSGFDLSNSFDPWTNLNGWYEKQS